MRTCSGSRMILIFSRISSLGMIAMGFCTAIISLLVRFILSEIFLFCTLDGQDHGGLMLTLLPRVSAVSLASVLKI